MSRTFSAGILIAAALVAAVPAVSAFFPFRHVRSLADDDVTGFETPEAKVQSRAVSREEGGLDRVIRKWRDIAFRARRDAQAMEEPQRTRLLELAEWCEARAIRLEQSVSL